MVKFIHIRNYPVSALAQPRPLSMGGTTIAYEVVNESMTIRYAVARCHSKKDRYCRKTGRMVAQGRLENPRTCIVIEHYTAEEENYRPPVAQVLNHFWSH